jgi:transcriptional regulator with XRE-family HTH domain
MSDCARYCGIAVSVRTLVRSARQIHAARVILGWTQPQLSDAAGVGIATVKRLEFNHRDKDLLEIMTIPTLSKIVKALEDQGIEFTVEEGGRRSVLYTEKF